MKWFGSATTLESEDVYGFVTVTGVGQGDPVPPFTVTLSSGRQVQVFGPEMIAFGRRRYVVSFVDEQGYDRFVIISHDHINSIDHYDPVRSPATPE